MWQSDRMTLTTTIRIKHPVNPVRLLDHVTRVAGGDPAKVLRNVEVNYIANRAGQGLKTLAGVSWTEGLTYDEYDQPAPPACVRLWVDNPYGFGSDQNRGRWVQANEILPAVVDWLDAEGVSRGAWWWEDETAGTWHPGTCDVRQLDSPESRATWHPGTTDA